MTNTNVALPLDLEAKARWTNLERRVAFLELVTRLHSPNSATRRRGIRAKLYDELLVDSSAATTKALRDQAMRKYLERYCDKHRQSMLRRSPVRAYWRRLCFGPDSDVVIHKLLTVGLLTKVLLADPGKTSSEERKGQSSERTLENALEYVRRRYSASSVFAVRDRTRLMWPELKRVAHFCAALIDTMVGPAGNMPVVDRTALDSVEERLPVFLAYCHFYQRLLTSNEPINGTRLRAGTRTQLGLALLPALRLDMPTVAMGPLPAP